MFEQPSAPVAGKHIAPTGDKTLSLPVRAPTSAMSRRASPIDS
jgi:hypothetical protein